MGKKGLQRSLRSYLSKLMKVPSHLHIRGRSPHPSTAAAANWILSACKYPRTPSFAEGRWCSEDRADHGGGAGVGGHAATLSDVDRFLQENFNSLYRRDDETAEDMISSGSSPPPPPQQRRQRQQAFRSSERFFVSPATSSSLLEEGQPPSAGSSPAPSCSSSRTSSSDAGLAAPGGRVAVMTFSKEPYHDFRRSMEDMVEARHADRAEQELDWDFMEELLFCYLELNDRSVHKHILRAFADLAVSYRLRRRWAAAPADGKGRRSPAAQTSPSTKSGRLY